ncbi:MAG: hypothetical protein HY074_11780 [Deltaproteobacteria bacterium]|nr:hypothetical protein [Deltaproteobacteria bacterium]
MKTSTLALLGVCWSCLALADATEAQPLKLGDKICAETKEMNGVLNSLGKAQDCMDAKPGANALDPADGLMKFCSKPVEAACGPKNERGDARAATLERVKAEIENASLLRVAKFLGIANAENFDIAALDKLEKTDPRLYRKGYKWYSRFLVEETALKFGGGAAADLYAVKYFTDIQSKLEKNIAQRPGLSKVTKKAMIRKIRSVEYVEADDLLTGDHASTDLMAEFVTNCGADGMEDNAISTSYTDSNGHEKEVFYICPGSLIATAANRSANDPHWMIGLSMTIGHELAHKIDYTDYPSAYEKMRLCLREHHKAELNGLIVKGKAVVEVKAYMSEISADYWGSEVLAEYLKNQSDPREKLKILQEAVQDLCGTPDVDNVHPSGEFRIRNLVRSNPKIHAAIGCPVPPPTAKPACNLEGAVKGPVKVPVKNTAK